MSLNGDLVVLLVDSTDEEIIATMEQKKLELLDTEKLTPNGIEAFNRKLHREFCH